MARWRIGILTLAGLTGFRAPAADNCAIIGINESGFQSQCDEARLAKGAGSSLPSFVDGFNNNPGAIPVRETPLGLELIASTTSLYSPDPTYNLAVIRGFQRFGAALSTNSDNTFYSLSATQAGSTSSSSSGTTSSVNSVPLPSLNIGTAFDLTTLLKSGSAATFLPTLGISAVYNRIKGVWGMLPGLAFSSEHISLGFSYLQEPSVDIYPSEGQFRASAGLGLGVLQAELLYLRGIGSYYTFTSQDPWAWITTVTLRTSHFQAFVGYKSYLDLFASTQNEGLLGLQIRPLPRLQVGYLLNYVRGCHSLGVQALLL